MQRNVKNCSIAEPTPPWTLHVQKVSESLQPMNHVYTMLWSTVQAEEKHMPKADLQSLRQLGINYLLG